MNPNDFRTLCESAYCRICYEPFEALNIVYKEHATASDLNRALLSLFNKKNFFDHGRSLLFCGQCKMAVHKACYQPEQTFPIEVQLSKTEKLSLKYFECPACMERRNTNESRPSSLRCYFCDMPNGFLVPLRINSAQPPSLQDDSKPRRESKTSATARPVSKAYHQSEPSEGLRSSPGQDKQLAPLAHTSPQRKKDTDPLISSNGEGHFDQEDIPAEENGTAKKVSSENFLIEKESIDSPKANILDDARLAPRSVNIPVGDQPLFCHAFCGLFNQSIYLDRKEFELSFFAFSKKSEDSTPCDFCNRKLKYSSASCTERFCSIKVHLYCLLEERVNYMISNKLDRNNPILWNVQPAFSFTPPLHDNDNNAKAKGQVELTTASKKASSKTCEPFSVYSLVPNCAMQTANTLTAIFECLKNVNLFKAGVDAEYADIVKEVAENYRQSLKFVNCLSLKCERHKRMVSSCICGEVQKSPQLIECENCFNWVHVECELERDAEVARFVCTKCRALSSLCLGLAEGGGKLDLIQSSMRQLDKTNLSIYEYLQLSKYFARGVAFDRRAKLTHWEGFQLLSQLRATDSKGSENMVKEVFKAIAERCYNKLLTKISEAASKNLSSDCLADFIFKAEDMLSKLDELRDQLKAFEISAADASLCDRMESLKDNLEILSSSGSQYSAMLRSVYDLVTDNPGLSPEFKKASEQCLRFYRSFVATLKAEFQSMNGRIDSATDKVSFILDNKICLLKFFKENKEAISANKIIQRILPAFMGHYNIISYQKFVQKIDSDHDCGDRTGVASHLSPERKAGAKSYYTRLMRVLADRGSKEPSEYVHSLKAESTVKRMVGKLSKSFFEPYHISKAAPASDLKHNYYKYENFIYEASGLIASAVMIQKIKVQDIGRQYVKGRIVPLETVEQFLGRHTEFKEVDSYIKLEFLANNSRSLFNSFSKLSKPPGRANSEVLTASGHIEEVPLFEMIRKLIERHGFLPQQVVHQLIVHDGINYLKRFLKGKTVRLQKVKDILKELLPRAPAPPEGLPNNSAGEAAMEIEDQANVHATGPPNEGSDQLRGDPALEVSAPYSHKNDVNNPSSAEKNSQDRPTRGGWPVKVDCDLSQYLSEAQLDVIYKAERKASEDHEMISRCQSIIVAAIGGEATTASSKRVSIDDLQGALEELSRVSVKEYAQQINSLNGLEGFLHSFSRMIPVGITTTNWTLEEVVKLGLKSKHFIDEFIKHNKLKGLADAVHFLSLFAEKSDVMEETFTRLARHFVEDRLRQAEGDGEVSLERVCEALNTARHIKDSSFDSYVREKKVVSRTLKFFRKLAKLFMSADSVKSLMALFSNAEVIKVMDDFYRKAGQMAEGMTWMNGQTAAKDALSFAKSGPLESLSVKDSQTQCQQLLNDFEALEHCLSAFEKTDEVYKTCEYIHALKMHCVLLFKHISLYSTGLSKSHLKFAVDLEKLARDFAKSQKVKLNSDNAVLMQAIDYTKGLLDYHKRLRGLLERAASPRKPSQQLLLAVSLLSQPPDSCVTLDLLEDFKQHGKVFECFLHEDYQELKLVIQQVENLENDVQEQTKALQKWLSGLLSQSQWSTKILTGATNDHGAPPDSQEADSAERVYQNMKAFFLTKSKHKPKQLYDMSLFENKYIEYRQTLARFNCGSRGLHERLIQFELLTYAARLLFGPKSLKDCALFSSLKLKAPAKSSIADLGAFETVQALVVYVDELALRHNQEIDIADVEEFMNYDKYILPNDFPDLPDKTNKLLMALQALAFLIKGVKRKEMAISAMDYKLALNCLLSTNWPISRELGNIVLRAIKRETRLVKLKSRLFGPPKYPFTARYLLDKYTELLEFDQSEMEELARKYLAQVEKYLSIRFKILEDPKYSSCADGFMDYSAIWSVFQASKSLELDQVVSNQLAQIKSIVRFAVGCEKIGTGHLHDINSTLKQIAQGAEPWRLQQRDLKQGLPERSLLVRLTEETLSPGDHQSFDLSHPSTDFTIYFQELKVLDLLDPILVSTLQLQIILHTCLLLSNEKIVLRLNDLKALTSKIAETKNLFAKSELPQDLGSRAASLLASCWHYCAQIFKDTQEHLKSFINQTLQTKQQAFKHQGIVSLNEILAQPSKFKEESIDVKSGFDKLAKADFNFFAKVDVPALEKGLVDLEKAMLLENDKKYKDKKDRYNLNLKDVKTDYQQIISEEVEQFSRTVSSHYEQHLKNDQAKEKRQNSATGQIPSHRKRDFEPGPAPKPIKKSENDDDAEFSPIVSENQSFDGNNDHPSAALQPKILFRNLISESQRPESLAIPIDDLIDAFPNFEDEDKTRERDDNKMESPTANLNRVSGASFGNLQSMLGQLKLSQRIKKAIQDNPKFTMAESKASLAAFCKKLESNFHNLKILYPQVTSDDIINFLKRYKHIDRLIKYYAKEKITYAILTDLIAHPKKKLREAVKRATPEQVQKDSLLNDLFEDQDIEQQRIEAKISRAANKQKVSPVIQDEAVLMKADASGQEPPLIDSFGTSQSNGHDSGPSDLLKRIKTSTINPPKSPALIRVTFPKKNKIMFVKDTETPSRETTISDASFITVEQAKALGAFPGIERPPKIRLNQFKKPIRDLETEYLSRDRSNPSTLVGLVELPSRQLEEDMKEIFDDRCVWGYSCSPNLHFYICHLSVVGGQIFEALKPIFETDLGERLDFASTFVFFLKRVPGENKLNKPLEFSIIEDEKHRDGDFGPNRVSLATEKFAALTEKRRQSEYKADELLYDRSAVEDLPKYPPAYHPPPLVSAPTQDLFGSQGPLWQQNMQDINEPAILAALRLNQFRQGQQAPLAPPFQPQQPGFAFPANSGNLLLDDLRQSNQGVNPTSEFAKGQAPAHPYMFANPMSLNPNMPFIPPPFSGLPIPNMQPSFGGPLPTMPLMGSIPPGHPHMIPNLLPNALPTTPPFNQALLGLPVPVPQTPSFYQNDFKPPQNKTPNIQSANNNKNFQQNHPAPSLRSQLMMDKPSHTMASYSQPPPMPPSISGQMPPMTFNFESTLDQPDVSQPYSSLLKDQGLPSRGPGLPLNIQFESAEEALSPPVIPPSQSGLETEDPELIDLVKENDLATLAECYTEAEGDLRSLLLQHVRAHAPEKLDEFLRLITK